MVKLTNGVSVSTSVTCGLIVKFPESGVRIRREINVPVVASRGATDPDLGFLGVQFNILLPTTTYTKSVGYLGTPIRTSSANFLIKLRSQFTTHV